jgi:hypothetical protein
MKQPGVPPTAELAQTETKSLWWRLQGIFFEPTTTFREIRERPSWLIALILTMLISVISAAIIFQVIDYQEFLRTQIEASPTANRLTDEQIDEIVEQSATGTRALAMRWAAPLLLPVLLLLVMTAPLMLMVYVAGGEITFAKVSSVVIHSLFAYFLITSALSVTVFLLSDDPNSINPQTAVYSNLGPLVDSQQYPVLNQLAASIDVLIFYLLYLIGLGLSTVAKRISLLAGMVMIGLLYAAGVALAASLSALL